ncbi:polyprotein [Gossypium australe]|uniref:Polyprotein n=1 Tax=Gossypium australe TaxID=47621 RepID=A0A5B6WXL8_9ROSI|nr:polyprotein [Gossypium australe]
MDFIKGLPNTKGKSVFLVVIDRLTKFVHFLALSHPYIAMTVAQKYLNHIFKLHSLLDSIILDKDRIFVSNFWMDLFKRVGTKLHLSTSYHPETDGQTEDLATKGGAAPVQNVLPVVDVSGAWIKEPARILDRHMV